jgi:hypothetical protein
MARSPGQLSDDGKTLTVEMSGTLLDDIETGMWCPDCSLPSAAQGTAAFEVEGLPLLVVTITRCLDCGWKHATAAHDQ